MKMDATMGRAKALSIGMNSHLPIEPAL